MMKNIKFYPTSKKSELVVPSPKPASFYMPDWYKGLRSISGDKIFKDGAVANKTVKSCLPYLDAMTAGYIQETWCEIEIVKNSIGDIEFHYASDPQIISARPLNHVRVPDYFYNAEFLWKMPWMPKLDNGYSCLFVHPLNNINLPFQLASGLIDSDFFYTTSVDDGPNGFPFYIKNGFEGTIPIGTPMYQMIPIKRDFWQSSCEKYDENFNYKQNHKINKLFSGGYKKYFHQKKFYR